MLLQVFISSKNIHIFFSKYLAPLSENSFFLFFSIISRFSASFIMLGNVLLFPTFLSLYKKSTISWSVIPACIFNISILLSPLLINSDNFLIREVLPHPVSPIIMTGIFSLIRSNIKTILMKLSAVNTYSPTISSIDL